MKTDYVALTAQPLVHEPSALWDQPQLVLHTIQAEALVSYYYLNSHFAAASSLASCVGINGMGSFPNPVNLPFLLSGCTMPGPRDDVEATERINAFWALLVLNNYWVAASGAPSGIPYDLREVSIQWPTVRFWKKSIGWAIDLFYRWTDFPTWPHRTSHHWGVPRWHQSHTRIFSIYSPGESFHTSRTGDQFLHEGYRYIYWPAHFRRAVNSASSQLSPTGRHF